MTVRVNVLGGLEVWRQGAPIGPFGATFSGVLGLLTLHEGRPVSGQRLMRRLRIDDDQAGKRKLRRTLDDIEETLCAGSGQVRLERCREGSSQTLHLPAESSDLACSRELDRAARTATTPQGAAETWSAALAQWRGPALDGLDVAAEWPERAALAEEHGQLLECQITAFVMTRAADEAMIETLHGLMRAQPEREQWPALLMDALVAKGRPDEAKAIFDTARATLVNLWGLEPGPELCRRHRRLDGRQAGAGPDPGAQEISIIVVSRLPGRHDGADDEELDQHIRDHGGIVVWRMDQVLMGVFTGLDSSERALTVALVLQADRARRRVLASETTISVTCGGSEWFEPANAARPGTTVLAGRALAEGREQYFDAPPGSIVVDERTARLTGHRAQYRALRVGYRLVGHDPVSQVG